MRYISFINFRPPPHPSLSLFAHTSLGQEDHNAEHTHNQPHSARTAPRKRGNARAPACRQCVCLCVSLTPSIRCQRPLGIRHTQTQGKRNRMSTPEMREMCILPGAAEGDLWVGGWGGWLRRRYPRATTGCARCITGKLQTTRRADKLILCSSKEGGEKQKGVGETGRGKSGVGGGGGGPAFVFRQQPNFLRHSMGGGGRPGEKE